MHAANFAKMVMRRLFHGSCRAPDPPRAAAAADRAVAGLSSLLSTSTIELDGDAMDFDAIILGTGLSESIAAA